MGGSIPADSVVILFTQNKSTWLSAISSHCPAALSAKMSAFSNHMQQNAYFRNNKWNFEDLLPYYCYAIKTKSRTIRSQVSQPVSAEKVSDMNELQTHHCMAPYLWTWVLCSMSVILRNKLLLQELNQFILIKLLTSGFLYSSQFSGGNTHFPPCGRPCQQWCFAGKHSAQIFAPVSARNRLANIVQEFANSENKSVNSGQVSLNSGQENIQVNLLQFNGEQWRSQPKNLGGGQNVRFWANNIILFRKTPLKAQNDYIFPKFGGHGPFGPPWLRLWRRIALFFNFLPNCGNFCTMILPAPNVCCGFELIKIFQTTVLIIGLRKTVSLP